MLLAYRRDHAGTAHSLSQALPRPGLRAYLVTSGWQLSLEARLDVPVYQLGRPWQVILIMLMMPPM